MITDYVIGIDKLKLTLKQKPVEYNSFEKLFSNNDSHKFTNSNNDKAKRKLIKDMVRIAVDEYDKQALSNVRMMAIGYDMLEVYEAETKNINFIKPAKPVSKSIDGFTDIDFDSLF